MICIACDHGGYEMKEHLKGYLQGKGYEVKDLGCDSSAAVDYPLYGQKAGECVATGEAELGIIICGTGLGISIAANKVKGIRCAHVCDPLTAEMTRRHNDANMIALGAGITGKNLAERCVEVFLATEFEGGRHARRVGQLDAIEP